MAEFADLHRAPPRKAPAAPAAAQRKAHETGPARRPAGVQIIQLRAKEKTTPASEPRAANGGGLPARLRAGIEALSGLFMGEVRVHRNSPEPAKMGALAYTKGADIHLGPGQERHLPHEAWHVVQQKQGRVRATAQLKGVAVNADQALEAEADRMGEATSSVKATSPRSKTGINTADSAILQRKLKWKAPLEKDEKKMKSAGYSTITMKFIKMASTFWLNHNSDPKDPIIHVLDASKKYLLGEDHRSNQWGIDTKPWPNVDKITEYEKIIVPEVDEKRAGFYQKDNRFEQALESIHAYLLLVTLKANNSVGVLESSLLNYFYALDNPGAPRPPGDPWSGQAKKVQDDLGDVLSTSPKYENFILQYEAKERLEMQFYPLLVRMRKAYPPWSRLEKVYKLSVAFRAYAAGDLKALDTAAAWASAAGIAIGSGVSSQITSRGKLTEIHNQIIASMGFLSSMAHLLIDITSDGNAVQKKKLEDLTTYAGDRSSEINREGDSVRERYMAFNIRVAASPLLVRLGNDHVTNVADLVGRTVAVPVYMGTGLENLTRQP